MNDSDTRTRGSVEDDDWDRPRTAVERRASRRLQLSGVAVLAVLAGAAVFTLRHGGGAAHAGMPAMPPPVVTVSVPMERSITPYASFLGQFSAVDQVDLHAQVGGILTEIHFTDGQIVHKGDLLFVIDPRPYQIKLAQAVAQARAASAQLTLAGSELWRAKQLKSTDFGTAQQVDQRSATQLADQASLDQARAAIQDAQLDLEYCQVTAPFTGRISSHRASVGSLVDGSRGGNAANTLLTTIVSLDPIHVDFDMSEADYLSYQRTLQKVGQKAGTAPDRTVQVSLADETHSTRTGTLDFLDNAVDRGSGTIHARATVANPSLFLAPGEFARLRLPITGQETVMLVPAAAVMLDQSQQLVLTVAPDGTVVPKLVQTGGLERGLRIVRSGLKPTDRVIIDGLMRARPGTKVNPAAGTIRLAAADDQG